DPGARIILSSGYDERDAISRIGRDERVEFLQKPYRGRTLLTKIRAVLDRYDREPISPARH
ncbi:MAG TPA: hypothetical protein VIE88_18580, partial [Vicinamibacteria bacterium]